MRTLTITLGLALSLSSLAVTAATKDVDLSKLPPPLDKQGATYARDIKPLFKKSCCQCHGPEKQKGKLRLDSLEAALKGGEEGKVIKPGESARSVLVHAVARIAREAMPPKDKGQPLTREEVGLIRAWIDQGAK
jgi:mono/diheme cytochrome c family protein